jgi:LysM repeat protein
MLEQAKRELDGGNKSNAEKILLSLIQDFPESAKVGDAKRMLGDLNVSAFFSPEPGPDKMEYVVARGDSIAKIAAKTKAPAELIFKANGLSSLTIHPGERLVIPKAQFSLVINTKKGDVTLMNNGVFFRWYRPSEVKLPGKVSTGQFKVREKIAWSNGTRVAFGEKKYLGSSRWIVINPSGITLYSETNPQTPDTQKPGKNPQTPDTQKPGKNPQTSDKQKPGKNLETSTTQKPGIGIMLEPADMEELYALVGKDTPVIIK